MTNFIIHDTDSAPDKSRELLVSAEQRWGFVPNILGIMAEAPATLKSYLALTDALGETSFTPVEQQVIALTVSYENECTYCMAAHSAIAKMTRMSDADLHALRDGQKLKDPKLEALKTFTITVVSKKGWVSDQDQNQFIAAGFSRAQIFEVLVGVAMKTLSNYVNHVADTPLDVEFAEFTWSPEAQVEGIA